ncbi:MAG: hypothetical protein ACXQT5_04630, partial [Candidatus Syntropharchaeia archaeon]
VVTVRGDLIRKHPDVVEKIVKVHLRAQRYAMEHPEESVEIFNKQMPTAVKTAFGGESVWLPAVKKSLDHYLGLSGTFLGKKCDGQLVSNPHAISGCGMEFARSLREMKPPAITRELKEEDIFDYSFYDKAVE